MELERELKAKKQLEKARKKNLAKVNKIILECRNQLQGFETIEQLDICLQLAYEIDPAILNMPLRIYITTENRSQRSLRKICGFTVPNKF
ncbi:MAG: hypothetical protein R2827_11610 [Bdellovibrionales bacterium]